MSRKICFISNVASHYRKEVTELMDFNLQCDFVFGDKVVSDIKTFDTSRFTNKVEVVHNILTKEGAVMWQRGVLKYMFKHYDAYIVIDDICSLSSWALMILATLMRKKTFMWSHGYYGRESFLKKVIKWPFYHMATRIITYGNYSRGVMIKEGYKPEKISVLHNSLAYSEQLKVRKSDLKSNIYKEHFGNDNPNLIFIGRLKPIKKLDMIIEAMALLKDRKLYTNLTFIGDGEERTKLESLAKSYGLEKNVWFYGACYDERKNAELVYNADLCVAPGNIGLTAMHVLMFGCPAITHNSFPHQMPEFEAIQPGVTGDFFEFGSILSLADTIQRWFKDAKDRGNIRDACFKEIDTQWTPTFQYNAIAKSINNYDSSFNLRIIE